MMGVFVKERLIKLINVKSFVTLFLTVVFCYLALSGKMMCQDFMDVFKIVIVFYFGTQAGKNEG